MAKIAEIVAREIINFRGNPTVEVDVVLSDGTLGRAAAPYYTDHGRYKQVEVRDGNQWSYFGKGTMKALKNEINIIATKVVGVDAQDQSGVDHILMDLEGMHNKDTLYANVMLGVSFAVAKAAAASFNMPLYRYIGGSNKMQMPAPMMNVLSGGKHSGNNLDFREFMIVPVAAISFAESMRMCTEVCHALKSILIRYGRSTSIGGVGGFVPNLVSNEEALAVLLSAIKKAGYKPGEQIAMAVNVVASDCFASGEYNFAGEGFVKTPIEMVEYYAGLVDEYPIISIEDGMARNDRNGWKLFSRRLGGKIQLLGPDTFSATIARLGQHIESHIENSILIKINQIATLSETLDMISRAKDAGYTCIISSCSSETEDSMIADIAVGVSAIRIKGGLPASTSQIAVYNQLLRIEEGLGKRGN